MKKIHYSTIIAIAITALFIANVAGAETIQEKQARLREKLASSTAKIEDQIRKQENKLASSTERLREREAREASSTAMKIERLVEKFKTGIAHTIAKVNDRLGDAVNRLQKIDTRLQAQIAKFKAQGKDTSESEALLKDAQDKLVIAKEKVTALQTSLQSVLSENISTTTKKTIKTKANEANSYVKAAHQAYVKVVESLKDKKGKKDNNATSTATTTTP